MIFRGRLSVVMKLIRIRNNYVIGGIWIDVRISDGSRPFVELPYATDFPMALPYNVFVDIELPDNCDLVYRVEADPVTPYSAENASVIYDSSVYRIGGGEGNFEIGGAD